MEWFWNHYVRDEGFAYAESLADAGVAVEHTDYDDTIHGFANTRQLSEPLQ